MNRQFPIEFLLGIEIAKMILALPDYVGGTGTFVKTVTQGFTPPSERSRNLWTLACVGAPEGGVFNSDEQTKFVESITSNLQVFVYLTEANPALAYLKMTRFVQLFQDALADRHCNWYGSIPDISDPTTWTDGVPPDATPAIGASRETVLWYAVDYGGISVVAANYGYGDVFKSLGIEGKEYELQPPHYGIHFNLTATIGSSFM